MPVTDHPLAAECRSTVFLPNSTLQHMRLAAPTLGSQPWHQSRVTPTSVHASRMHTFTTPVLIRALSVNLTATGREDWGLVDFNRHRVWASSWFLKYVTSPSIPLCPVAAGLVAAVQPMASHHQPYPAPPPSIPQGCFYLALYAVAT